MQSHYALDFMAWFGQLFYISPVKYLLILLAHRINLGVANLAQPCPRRSSLCC